MEEKIKGFKGFDKDLKCNGFQYEIGKEYVHDGEVKLCSSGFHFCENPLDIFNYYPPSDSKFTEVEASKVSENIDSDSKRVCGKIKIGFEISLKTIIETGIKFIFEKTTSSKETKATTGNYANSATTGEGANSATTGSLTQNNGKLSLMIIAL